VVRAVKALAFKDAVLIVSGVPTLTLDNVVVPLFDALTTEAKVLLVKFAMSTVPTPPAAAA